MGQERPLRVLFVSHTALEGGAALSLVGLLRTLPPDEVSAVLACPGSKDSARGRLPDHVVIQPIVGYGPRWRLTPWGMMGQWVEARRFREAIRRAVQAHQPQLVHANGWPAALAAAWARLTIPLVWHARDLLVRPVITRALRRRCSRVIAVSGAVRDLLVQRGFDAQRVHVVYNGISPDEVRRSRSREAVRAELGVAAEAPLVCSVAWLEPWKRHEVMLKAAQLVIERRPQARFVFVGAEPPWRPGRMARLQELSRRLGVAAAVQFLGHRQDVADLLNAADVFMHAAEAEAFGRCVLEAMILGKPVVVVAAGGPAELVENEVSGLAVTPGSPEALAEGVLRMMAEPTLAQHCAENARQRALGEFSAQRMAEATLAVYRGMLEEARP